MKNYILTIPCILLILMNIGCRKFVELGPPDNLLINDNVYGSDETATGAMLGIYSEMTARGTSYMPYDFSALTGTYSDELETTSSIYNPVYEDALLPLNSPTNTMWTYAYSWIFQSNLVYEGCEKSESVNSSVKKQLMAEARFIRAYWYFYLVNLWGDVPMPLTASYQQNSILTRTSLEDVYQQIIMDLKYAQGNLNEKYVGPNSIATVMDRVRPNKGAATALLARVYLFTKDYNNAESQSTLLIGDKANYDLVGVSDAFKQNNKEAIWQLMTPISNYVGFVTAENYGFVLTGPPGDNFTNCNFISKQLLEAFYGGDKRKESWIGKFTNTDVIPNIDYYFPNKYKEISAPGTEASTVFRIAEQYLIRAEGRAQNGNLPGAIADVDMIRDRAGIDEIAIIKPTISKEALLDSIYKERQRELFTEWGHRWLDLKRTNKANEVMSSIATYKNTTWSGYKQLWPIPQNELDKDKKLKQNDGYEN